MISKRTSLKAKKPVLYCEAAYVIGLILVAFGVMLMEKADFGMSMLEVPSYLTFRRLENVWRFVSFGMAEYCYQALVLIVMMLIMRRFRVAYLFSFATAVLFGFMLDGAMLCGEFLPVGLPLRFVYYIVGMPMISAGVAFLFESYITPQAHELAVKELADFFNIPISRFKTCYDCLTCLLGIFLSFLFFGWQKPIGVGIGTVICACLNGFIIGRFSRLYRKCFEFRDRLPFRSFFEGTDKKEKTNEHPIGK